MQPGNFTEHWRRWFVSLLTLLASIMLLPALSSTTKAQSSVSTSSTTSAMTPQGMTPGSPAGAYTLSGFDDVNLANGNLNVRLPLLTVGGRGSADYTMMLSTSTKTWQVRTDPGQDTNGGGGPISDKFTPQWKRWNSLKVGYGAGVMQGRSTGAKTLVRRTCDTCPLICPRTQPLYMYTLTRLTFISSDGTEHELRDEATNGKPMLVDQTRCYDGGVTGFSRGTRFISADGSAMTFVSDGEISDRVVVNPSGSWLFSPSGVLYLRDGTRYGISNGSVVWIQDRNGNRIEVGSGVITDSLGRTVTVEYDLSEAPYGLHDRITYRGFGGALRVIRISKTSLSNALRAPYTIQTFPQLFPELNGALNLFSSLNPPSQDFNPSVVSTVWLPDNRTYKIFYNSYAEVARVELPTAGAFEYDMVPGSGVIVSPGATASGVEERQIYRRLKERRTYTGLTLDTLESRTVYTAGNGTDLYSDNQVKVEQYDAAGHLLALNIHFFSSSAAESLFTREEGSLYSPAGEGREIVTDSVDPGNQTTVLRRTSNVWAQREPVSWVGHLETRSPNVPPEGLAFQPDNNPRLTKVVTTLETNQVSQQEFFYDFYNNQTEVKEYGYGAGAPGLLVRRSHTDYLTTNPINGADYTATNIHLRSLPSQTSVYAGNDIERARTTFEYDSYGAVDSYHAAIVTYPRSGFSELPISGLDPSFNSTTNNLARGNLTKTTSSLLNDSGNVIGSISGYAQYDVGGNVVKAIDPRSTPANLITTTFDFSDRFGAPDGEAHANWGSTELNNAGQYSYAFPTLLSNAMGHTAYTQFDYYLGRPVDGEDANGIVSSGFYNDPLDRPTQVIRAANQGASVKSQTTFYYDDTNRVITTTSDQSSYNDNLLKSQTLYDRLGRTIESRQYETSTQYVAVKQVPFVALPDPDTGVWVSAAQSSNPYRPYLNEQPLWTTMFSDALGRTSKTRTPDNAVVSTTYSGNTVTVTDQNSKTRKSVSDALGRLKEVYEDPIGPNALNYLTSYSYDTLDNLTGVTQGTQPPRTFVYDSLKRLTSASNPESGTICYGMVTSGGQCQANGYDANGNLIYKTDARGVLSTYAYDVLNRNTSVSYSSDPAGTPTVHRYYDGWRDGNFTNIPNVKGRLWQAETSGANGSRTIINSFDALGRPLSESQQFYVGTAAAEWSQAYTVQRTPYNLAGHVLTETYPSGHVVNYSFDSAGRLHNFSGYLGDGQEKSYSSEIIYSPFGAMTKEKLGTDTAIYNKLFYNSRGQLAEIREGTSYTGPSDTGWERGAIINYYSTCWGMCGGSTSTTAMVDNNGNLKKQEVFVPGAGSWLQQYDYDSLNRLQRVHENTGNTQTDWQQEYVYDRYGNRTIHQTNTYGLGVNKKDFTVNTANNRLSVPSGQSGTMTYDNAGNLTVDTYSGGAGLRAYDAENRMTKETQANSVVAGDYTYNADGQRVRRKINGVETWQVYGMDGELLAEYAANAAVTSPQKEYGYRNGQLLITAEASSRTNVALAANGATATAQNYTQDGTHYLPSYAIDGQRYCHLTTTDADGFWRDEHGLSSWLQVDFAGAKTIDEVDVFTFRDDYLTQGDPSGSDTFGSYGTTSFEVQYWTGSAWATVSGGSITGNNQLWRKVSFSALTTTKIRLKVNASPDGVARIDEVEAWGGAAPTAVKNVAAAANGAIATAQNYTQEGTHYLPSYANDGQRYCHLTATDADGFWRDEHGLPSWVQVDFAGAKTIHEIDVYTFMDSYLTQNDPNATQTFSSYGTTGLSVQYWNGSSWTTVPGGTVTANNLVWRKLSFPAVTTTKIRVQVNAAPDGVARLTEVEAWGYETTNINWLVTDQLGTPRMIFDQTGALSTTKRHDYAPFGEELFNGLRTNPMGYAANDTTRQRFTSKERDNETDLDFFEARYYASTQGRFTSIDPYNIVMERQYATDAKKAQSQFTSYLSNPQRWARYTYALDNPLFYTDPHGEDVTIYYRPPDKDKGSVDDFGHILIYVKNDETKQSAYFDYYPENGGTALGDVNQQRIDDHHSLTIETSAGQEQAILDGIKQMQQGAPNFDAPAVGNHMTGGESTCVTQSESLLSRGGISLTSRSPTGVWNEAFTKYGDQSKQDRTSSNWPGFPNSRTYQPSVPLPPPNHPNPGKEYGHDPRGQARTLDTGAINNQKLIFHNGKRVN